MKKLFTVFAVTAIFLTVSCGGTPQESEKSPDSDDTVSDEESVDSSSTDMDETEQVTDDEPEPVSDNEPEPVTDDKPTAESPCGPNPCEGVSNATGECIETGDAAYACECNPGFNWTGSACQRDSSGRPKSLGKICTGQTLCYVNYYGTTGLTCPISATDFYGQDAEYTDKCTPQSFTVLAISSKRQKVVLDNNTGLMWQQSVPGKSYTWANAKTYCSNLEYAGYSDWRVPDPQELLTIVDNSTFDPAVSTTNFPDLSSVTGFFYLWTDKDNKDDTHNAYYFRPYSGDIEDGNPKTALSNIMCVRGNKLPKASFETQTISGDAVVKDSATGLMWQKEYVTDRMWQNALKYCEGLVYAGYDDWRLPNKNELASLLDYDRSEAPYSDFPDMPGSKFWSSTTTASGTDYAWNVYFNNGSVNGNYKILDSSIRCVR